MLLANCSYAYGQKDHVSLEEGLTANRIAGDVSGYTGHGVFRYVISAHPLSSCKTTSGAVAVNINAQLGVYYLICQHSCENTAHKKVLC